MADSKLLLIKPSSSTSPPPNCAICLGPLLNKCFSDTCMHQFCFKCLLQWSKIKAECPLCKQPFKSIIHNVKSNEEYEVHIVEETTTTDFNEHMYNIPVLGAPGSSRQHRFHFRTTFTVNTHGENAIQQMLLSHSLTNGISISNYMPEHNSIPNYPRLRRRLESYSTTNFRRSIYDNNLWANPLIDVMTSFRDVSPEYFQANPASRTRLAPWLNRELNALLGADTHFVMLLVDSIMEKLLTYHIRSHRIKILLRAFLTDQTDHFIYEFYNFMRSPFDMIGYDRHVTYSERPPTPLIDISEDEDNSDVMIVEQNIDVIEVSSDDSDDEVTITSVTAPPKPFQPGNSSSHFKRIHERSRNVEISSSSSSSSSNEQKRSKDDKNIEKRKKKDSSMVKHRRKMSRPPSLNSDSSELDDVPLAALTKMKKLKRKSTEPHRRDDRKRLKKTRKSKKSERGREKHRSKRHHHHYRISKRDSSSSSSSSSCRYPSRNSSRNTSRNEHQVSSQVFIKDGSVDSNSQAAKNPSNSGASSERDTCRKFPEACSSSSTSSSFFRSIDKIDGHGHRHNNVSPNYQNWCEGPSTSSLRGKSKSHLNHQEPIKFTVESRIYSDEVNGGKIEDDNEVQPLELTNNSRHCNYSPYVSNEQNRKSSSSPKPIISTMNRNQNLTTNVSQSMNFFNAPSSNHTCSSTDLMDLSEKSERNCVEHSEESPSSANTSVVEPVNCESRTNLTNNDMPETDSEINFKTCVGGNLNDVEFLMSKTTNLLSSFLHWTNYPNGNNSENSD